jgi:hypothetical protein
VQNVLVVHRFSDLSAVGDEGSRLQQLAEGVVSETATRVVYRQAERDVQLTAEVLGLSDEEAGCGRTAGPGRGAVAPGGQELPGETSDLKRGMATHTDRQSDGRTARRRGRPVRALPVGLHGAFQVAWALAMAFPLATEVEDLVGRPHPVAALGVIEVSAVWAVVAALAWTLRLLTLSTCGSWGSRQRQRVRESGRRRMS